MIEKVISFLKEFNYEDIPEVSKDNAARNFLDIIGVSASATKTELSKIVIRIERRRIKNKTRLFKN